MKFVNPQTEAAMGNFKNTLPVIVAKDEFDDLIKARQKLTALEESGVQHWSNYATAMALIDVESDPPLLRRAADRGKDESRTR